MHLFAGPGSQLCQAAALAVPCAAAGTWHAAACQSLLAQAVPRAFLPLQRCLLFDSRLVCLLDSRPDWQRSDTGLKLCQLSLNEEAPCRARLPGMHTESLLQRCFSRGCCRPCSPGSAALPAAMRVQPSQKCLHRHAC